MKNFSAACGAASRVRLGYGARAIREEGKEEGVEGRVEFSLSLMGVREFRLSLMGVWWRQRRENWWAWGKDRKIDEGGGDAFFSGFVRE
jgi:hypothetical protein